MDGFSKILTDKWKTMIESIIVDGHSRKIESVNLFRMNKYYTGYPEIEFCYKVTFNFPLGGSQEYESAARFDSSPYSEKTSDRIDKWHEELESIFTNMFWDPSDEVMPRAGSNYGETKFENSRVDYMTNQGFRFIVQFYPQGFVSEFRNEKLKELGI